MHLNEGQRCPKTQRLVQNYLLFYTVNPPIEPALKYNPPSNTTLSKALILLSKILPSKSTYENRTRGCIGGFTVIQRVEAFWGRDQD